MTKLQRTIEVEGGEYVDRATGERIQAVRWEKDGDHPLVTRYPIEGRNLDGILDLGPKNKFALRFGDWVCQETGEKARMFIVDGDRFPVRFQEAEAYDKEQAEKAAAAAAPGAGAQVVAILVALTCALFGDPQSLPWLLVGVTHLMYYSSIKGQWDGTTNGVFDLDTDTMKTSAHTNTYAPNQDTHDFFDDVTNEVTGTGYTAGGATLGTVTVTRSTTTVTFDAADVVWTQNAAGFSTGRKFVTYKSTGTPSTSRLFSVVTADQDVGNVAGDLTIQWNASGIAQWSTT